MHCVVTDRPIIADIPVGCWAGRLGDGNVDLEVECRRRLPGSSAVGHVVRRRVISDVTTLERPRTTHINRGVDNTTSHGLLVCSTESTVQTVFCSSLAIEFIHFEDFKFDLNGIQDLFITEWPRVILDKEADGDVSQSRVDVKHWCLNKTTDGTRCCGRWVYFGRSRVETAALWESYHV